MNKNSILRTLLPAVMAIAITVPALAVSDNEMEQARTIAAKMYLRYANNGSGYLDDVKATNMADLQKVLKKKEQENIKAFLSIPVPKDYAQWDKAKLVEYWSATAFNAPGLIEQGQGAKSRVRKQIEAMTVSAPAAQPTPASVDPEVTAPVAADTAGVCRSFGYSQPGAGYPGRPEGHSRRQPESHAGESFQPHLDLRRHPGDSHSGGHMAGYLRRQGHETPAGIRW